MSEVFGLNDKRVSAIFLKAIIFLIGAAVLTLCVYWLPVLTIRDVKAHPDGDYSLYPLLACAYGICLTFLFSLFHVYKLVTFIERNNAFSESSYQSLKVIKKCAFIVIGFFVFMIISLKVISSISGDDSAGPISLSLMSILATSIIIAVVDVLQKPITVFLEKE
ncbi:Protein of unknown function (DUF2975) [Bacillus sp. V-88]|nr:Protein of unknown function (DUF2975) [Bacillus sp. V-88]SLK24782.1 Protein of unknown function [Bacillus sp. V-88]